MLYLIGLGLNDEGDLTLKAVDILKKCDKVYAELYTNVWHGSFPNLEKLVGKPIQILEREKVESEFLTNEAKDKDIVLLIAGDPLSATTHFELITIAKQKNIKVEIVHSSSIYTAVAETGLQIYKFGRTTTVPKPIINELRGNSSKYKITSPYDVIVSNEKLGYHTLVLLDIGMTVKDGLNELLRMESEINKGIINKNTPAIACYKLGSKDRKIIYDSVEKLIERNLQDVPAVVIILGNLNFKEEEALELWKIK